MEHWEQDFEWLRVRHFVKDALKQEALPDMNAILFLIGIQELGQLKPQYTKEEKQDLMHIAVCRLLSEDGYFEFEGIDAEGWPHWKNVRNLDVRGLKNQEELLKDKVVAYFKALGG
jgi:hypothetical protein